MLEHHQGILCRLDRIETHRTLVRIAALCPHFANQLTEPVQGCRDLPERPLEFARNFLVICVGDLCIADARPVLSGQSLRLEDAIHRRGQRCVDLVRQTCRQLPEAGQPFGRIQSCLRNLKFLTTFGNATL